MERGLPQGDISVRLTATLLLLGTFGSAAAAADSCSPHCDYNHYYGPYLFSYEEPGLYGYPVCSRTGNCSPFLAYGRSPYWSFSYTVEQRGRITIRFPRVRAPRSTGFR